MSDEKTQLTPGELMGYGRFMQAAEEMAAVQAGLTASPAVAILFTEKVYLAQQNLSEARASVLRYLSVCGVDRPEEVTVTREGMILRNAPTEADRAAALDVAAKAREAMQTMSEAQEEVPAPVPPWNQPTEEAADATANPG